MMNGGPYREPRLTDRRTASRPGSTHRQSEEPQPVDDESKAPARSVAPRYPVEEQKPSKRLVWPIVAIVAVIIAALVGFLVWSTMRGSAVGIDSSKYQAVFFTNGQVYFGKLASAGSGYLTLTDIYYLQSQTSAVDGEEGSNPQETSSDQSNFQLIKLGEEIHGPEDAMTISKDQVLFYENLKPDGRVSKSIEQHKGAN